MATCTNCGANLEATDQAVRCTFCDTVNAPPPKEVQVPVAMQVVHQTVNVVSDGAKPVELRCPHCRKRLVTATIDDVSLSGCGGCGGIWVDNASAQRLVTAPQRVFIELSQRAAVNATGPHTRLPGAGCPICTAVLDRARQRGIELDVCPEHGTWFDKRELHTLLKALRGEDGPAAYSPPPGHVTCAGCGISIERSRANVTGEGSMCDGCWRTRQQAAIAAADRRHNEGAVVTAGTAAILMVGLLGGLAAGSSSRSS